MNTFQKWNFRVVIMCLLTAGPVESAEGHVLASEGIPEVAHKSEAANQRTLDPPEASLAASKTRSSVSLAPAIAMVKCKFGQSYTQPLTLFNGTQQDIVSEMVAEDVVVRNGIRVFIVAGEMPGSIAATAVFSQKQVVIKPGQSASVNVTFTVPPETPIRAAVALFHGTDRAAGNGSVMMTASLGALFTFTVSEDFQIEGSPITVRAQSATTNLSLSQALTNTGSEPLIAHGTAALLNDAGVLIGKAPFEEQRLLPGERLLFQTEYPTELKTGNYHVFASFQYEKKVITSLTDFTVP